MKIKNKKVISFVANQYDKNVFIKKSGLPVIYLQIGEIFITKKPVCVMTVLGSCVAVTMFNPAQMIGGICHGYLPNCNDTEKCKRDIEECMKYVDCAVDKMLQIYLDSGIYPNEINVNLFGGSHLLSDIRSNSDFLNVGERNVNSAKDIIKRTGLNLKFVNVGGKVSRKIKFFPHTGKSILKIRKTNF